MLLVDRLGRKTIDAADGAGGLAILYAVVVNLLASGSAHVCKLVPAPCGGAMP